ncbi:MAG: hypothetical protein A6F70_01630 [Cycloclasticus sp. symbiont of Bathymodiolus heckerae]|nr:MAG: hypothetical protein A6F70_01630 [Cycloclasticus sp. symbiont of Bathymodiolus heckerae]
MEIEPIDVEYWQGEDIFTVWQAAFAMCDIEPWDEPISTNATPPKNVENMRTQLLANIPHYQTGQIFAQSGWSCKAQRPAQLSGYYFSRSALKERLLKTHKDQSLPIFLMK